MKISLIISALLLSLPAYMLGKWAENRIKPRQSFVRFFLWAFCIVFIGIGWLFVCLFLYANFFMHKA